MLFDTVNILIFNETSCLHLLRNRQIFYGVGLLYSTFDPIVIKWFYP